MEGEQFSLCWNNFHSNLSSGFHALYKEEDLVDVTLAAEGKYIKAHKTVLSVCSPYFKELFRINPCKHPIVILQDVNYGALCSLLQFMYQGQVSVSQEEIPTFMRVAETLKVKGLTDNGSSNLDSNGVNSFSDQRMKKPLPRPVKKLVRPLQTQQRPSGSPIPRIAKSPLPTSSAPLAKKMHLDEQVGQKVSVPQNVQHQQLNQQQQSSTQNTDYREPLLQPKLEPLEQPDDDDSTQQSFDEEQFDMNSMLSQSIDAGENSGESMPPGWNPENVKSLDTSSPGDGKLIFLRSGKGQLVLIHKGQMYTLGKARNDRYMWICVKKNSFNCKGCVITVEGPNILTHTVHNHPPLYDVIRRLHLSPISPETLEKLSKKN